MNSQDRLADWKNFRQSIAELSDIDKFKKVVEYWSQAPLEKIAYDIEDVENIPTPWEMMDANDWCRNSIAIGMEFTLRLSGVDKNRMELRMIIDPSISDMMLALIIDNRYILNYDWGNIYAQKLPKEARIIKRIKYIKNGYEVL